MMRRLPLPDTYPALIDADAALRFYASRRDSSSDAIHAFYTVSYGVIQRFVGAARSLLVRDLPGAAAMELPCGAPT